MWKQASCEPAGPSDDGRSHNMPASSIKAVGRIGEADGNAEADAPGRNCHELRLNGLVPTQISMHIRRWIRAARDLLLPCIQDL